MPTNIESIVDRLNVALSQSSLKTFQNDRAARLGKTKPGSRHLISRRTTHERYAYHDGGRSEVQFNIGLERPRIFRYGIAISLQRDRTVLDPVTAMSGRVRKLRELIQNDPGRFQGLKMWRYHGGDRSRIRNVEDIPDDWITANSFIFIGVRKTYKGLKYNPSSGDIAAIVRLFERLHPVYVAIEEEETVLDRYRAARIVWNELGWKRPSGPAGKLRNKKNFEFTNGFGLEEWIFDDTRLIDDYHYSFLQCFGHHHGSYAGRTFDVLLYSINSRSKRRVWIGRIANVYCLTSKESGSAVSAFRKRGWLDEMAAEVDQIGGNSGHFSTAGPVSIINCKYQISDVEIFDEPRPELSHNDEYLKAFYYDTFTKLPSARFYSPESHETRSAKVEIPDNLSDFGSEGMEKRRTRTWSASTDPKHADLKHKRWQVTLLKRLRTQFGDKNAGVEVPAGGGYADVVLHSGKSTLIIELKTGNSARQIVREALGQIVEYGFWPGNLKPTQQLVIAGQTRPDIETANYLAFLRKEFRMPVWYSRFDPNTGELDQLDRILGR